MFPVLLHPELYRRLRRGGRGETARFFKTLTRLRAGHWGGGTRVKRLRGISRPVYEARTDAGDRLLFTVVRSAEAEAPGRSVPHLQIWDLVPHDDAERTARRNRSPDAEFLELDTLEELAIEEPPPHPAASFADIPSDDPADASEPLLRFLLAPGDADVEAGEETVGGIRWFRLDPAYLVREEELQRLFDTGGDELELKLTREQYEILRRPGPLLLAGSAGSGKTTLAVHRLAAAALEPNPPTVLYLSLSAALVEHAKGLYGDLAAARGRAPATAPDFFTFTDLYRSLVPRDVHEHQARPMTEALFREWFRKSGRPLDPALVWEELRSILKGACLSLDQPMLDEAAYAELGRKRAPLFVDERPEIWRIAQRYQEWLAEEGRTDPIDLCRRAFLELRRRGPGHDVVICDEVQDLTELEVAFVLALSRRQALDGLLLTGDAQQIINPSGFRWAEVRRLAGKSARLRAAPEVVRLRRNLRSVQPLVELANRLLLLRREVFGRGEEDDPEEAALAGPVPVEVPGDEAAVLASIRGFGPRCAVLTSGEGEAERLRTLLGTSRVFPVREAKGLEFDSVVLWKLLAEDHELIERFLRAPDGMAREARFKRLLHHLYVGATRARRHLAIHEGPAAHPFWGDARFHGRLERGVPESLGRLFQATASPAAWEKEGDYFLEHGHWRQAAECFRRAGREDREIAALARAAEARDAWSEALTLWERLGAVDRQAPLLERLGRLPEALERYLQAGLPDDARGCELRLLECEGRWAAAAAGWDELGRPAEAVRCWQQAGDRPLALAHEAAGRPEDAAPLWEKLGKTHRAVETYARAGLWSEVARVEEPAPEGRQVLLPHLRERIRHGDWLQAYPLITTRIAVLRPRIPDAPWFVFDDAQRLVWQEVCLLEELMYHCEAQRAEEEGAWSRAARLWELAGNRKRAATARRRRIESIRDPERRARALRALRAAEPASSAGETDAGADRAS